MQAGKNGKTLTYKFALDAGTYDIVAGYYDPWAQWAGDNRHAKVSVTTDDGTELANEADHHISSEASVTFEDVKLDTAGNISLNTIPLKSGSDNCDVMISYIVIVKKKGAVEPVDPDQPDQPVPDEEKKAGLKNVIELAEKLNAENYTAESYAKLTAALTAAKEVYNAENKTDAEIQAQITAIFDAIKGLESADKAANEDLKKQLEEKTKQLEDKETELKTVKENVTTLQTQIKEAQDQLAALEDSASQEKAALEKKIEDLTAELNTARAEVLTLSSEKASLEEEKAALQAELKKVQDQAAKDSAEAEVAIKKAQEEARKAREEIEKLKDSMTLKNGDTVTEGGVQYRVTDAAAKTAEAYGTAKKNIKSINVAATVTIKGVTCKVTAVADQAFAGQKKATKAVIGANVTKIGKKAFYGDSRLKSITVKGKKLKMVGKQALKGINKHAVVRVPKAKKKAYKALFKGKGQKKSVKVK